MSDLPQADVHSSEFARMVGIAISNGWLFSVSVFVLLEIKELTFPPNGVIAMSTEMAVSAAVLVAVTSFVVGLVVMAPMAALLAWPAYKRRIRSHMVYIAMGAVVGLLTSLLFYAFAGIGPDPGIQGLMLFEWFIASVAFGGWSFADQLDGENEPKADVRTNQ